MKYFIPAIFSFAFALNVNSQSCTDCRYLSPVFDSITKETVLFARGVNADGDTQNLYMDVYQPYGDTLSLRPAMVFAFGGAFVQGSKNDWYVKEVCRHFTRAGYVSVAIDYRVGVKLSEILALQHMRIFFRPMQEIRAAVQHLKADYSELGNNWRIDTSRIIIGGASSGAISALMVAHCDKPSEMSEMGNINALNALGGFYSSSGFYQNYSWNSIGTVNIAGALINANWVEAGDKPIISAHGNADQVVPYAYGAFGGGLLGGVFDLQGSYVVDSIARTKGVCSYLYTMEGKDHPSEDMGMEYIYSVVYRIMLRMHALVNDRSFCCPLTADVTPGDTLFYAPGAPDATLTAQVSNDNGNAQLQWCSIPCAYSLTANSITVTPDTALHYVMLVASEGQCQSGDLYFLIDSTQLVSSVHATAYPLTVEIYPQPAADYFLLDADLSTLSENEGVIEIFDLTGRKLLRQHFYSSTDKLSIKVQTENLPEGAYLLTLQTDNGIAAVKQIAIVR
ncbi:MAG: T9SS type A sorting domain-containing protein [Chitinophagales bacterium]|nr:T9SS type A sorting domain-containing protein [Chitinophagales bacterium]